MKLLIVHLHVILLYFSSFSSDFTCEKFYFLIPSIINVCILLDHTKFLPSIHDCDQPHLLTKVIEQLVKHREKQSRELSFYLDFILLKSSRLPNAGLAQSYACSCASVSLLHVLPNVQVDLYKALLSRGCPVVADDVVAVARVLKKSQGQFLKVQHV